jgi:hypothetical protein
MVGWFSIRTLFSVHGSLLVRGAAFDMSLLSDVLLRQPERDCLTR